MDAFAVSISKGLAMRSFRWHNALAVGLCFGSLQALMPVIGYLVGQQFSGLIEDWDHWVAFALLTFIGINMIREGMNDEAEPPVSMLNLKGLFTLGIATSIDALAMGVSFAFLDVEICQAAGLIGVITALLCLIGVKSGHFLGQKFKRKAEMAGGVILLAIAINLLHEHGIF